MKTETKESINKLKKEIYVKLILLKIWFFKNIKTFLILAGIIAVLVIIGQSIKDSNNNADIDLLVNLSTTALSIISTILLIGKKTDKITLADIKNKKTKFAMVSAGLYFDERGKIKKRTKSLLDETVQAEDKKEEDETPSVTDVTENKFDIVQETKDAIEELGVILTSKIEEENKEEESQMEEETKKDSISSDNKILNKLISIVEKIINFIKEKIENLKNKLKEKKEESKTEDHEEEKVEITEDIKTEEPSSSIIPEIKEEEVIKENKEEVVVKEEIKTSDLGSEEKKEIPQEIKVNSQESEKKRRQELAMKRVQQIINGK